MFFISFLVDLLIILLHVFFFATLCRLTNLPLHVHVHQHNGCNRRFNGCLQQNLGESGCAISSWSASARYSASMLTRVAKVDSSSTRQVLAPSVNISADIQHCLIMTQCITLHSVPLTYLQKEASGCGSSTFRSIFMSEKQNQEVI